LDGTPSWRGPARHCAMKCWVAAGGLPEAASSCRTAGLDLGPAGSTLNLWSR
jgi:hypothetical protein